MAKQAHKALRQAWPLVSFVLGRPRGLLRSGQGNTSGLGRWGRSEQSRLHGGQSTGDFGFRLRGPRDICRKVALGLGRGRCPKQAHHRPALQTNLVYRLRQIPSASTYSVGSGLLPLLPAAPIVDDTHSWTKQATLSHPGHGGQPGSKMLAGAGSTAATGAGRDMARLLSSCQRLLVEIETRKSSEGNPCLCPIFGPYLAELPPKRLDLSRFYLSIIFCDTTNAFMNKMTGLWQ